MQASRIITGAIATAMLAWSAVAPAQDSPPQDSSPRESSAEDDTIVVEGQRETEAMEVRRQAQTITPRGAVQGEPLARFQQPICPGVWGLSGESAQIIIDRIYFNAEQIGLELDEEAGCAANVIVAFVPDPQEEFAQLRAVNHDLVAGLSYWERKRIAGQQGPALVWNVVTTRTSDGQTRMGDPPIFDTTQASRLTSGTRRDLELSMVMIASDAIADLDGIAVADYATMRTLARTRPPGEGEAAYGTILSLFDDPANAPAQLTDFDRAYLASLYSGRANLPGQYALRNVDDLMEDSRQTE